MDQFILLQPKTLVGIACLLSLPAKPATDSLHPNQSPVRQIVLAYELDLPFLGYLKTRTTYEITANPWSIGCETLGRGFADFDAYKDYLPALGAKIARIQSGWARTEKRQGEYDFAWLDHIVNGLIERGVRPWITVCYGNPIDSGGGALVRAEALSTWERYVTALCRRYHDLGGLGRLAPETGSGDRSVPRTCGHSRGAGGSRHLSPTRSTLSGRREQAPAQLRVRVGMDNPDLIRLWLEGV